MQKQSDVRDYIDNNGFGDFDTIAGHRRCLDKKNKLSPSTLEPNTVSSPLHKTSCSIINHEIFNECIASNFVPDFICIQLTQRPARSHFPWLAFRCLTSLWLMQGQCLWINPPNPSDTSLPRLLGHTRSRITSQTLRPQGLERFCGQWVINVFWQRIKCRPLKLKNY